MSSETAKIGNNGTFVIPVSFRKKYGLKDGSFVVAEERDNGILIRPATTAPEIEQYTPERIAEFLLSTAVDAGDYEIALKEVRDMGLDPDIIPHVAPLGKR